MRVLWVKLQPHGDSAMSSVPVGTVGETGPSGLQLELPQQPRVSGQDSDSPSSSGAFCQPGSLPVLVDRVLVVGRTAVVMGRKSRMGRHQRPSSSSSLPICFHGEKVFSVDTGFREKQNCGLVKG